MSEEIRRGGAARYLAMVACVLLGGFVYVGWRIKKGDELKEQHPLVAAVENQQPESQLSLSIPRGTSPKPVTASLNDADLLQDITIGSTEKEIPVVKDTPDDIDIEALLASTPDPTPTKSSTIGGVSGNSNLDILLPESENVVQAEVTPPPAPAPETLAKQAQPQLSEAATLPVTADYKKDANPEKNQDDLDNSTALDTAPMESLANVTYRDYTVKRGDTLSKIALQHLGSRKRAAEIYNINKDRMSSPNVLQVGMNIRIPFDHNSNRTSTHRITTTDSLPSIAMRYYGSAKPEIIEGIRLANPVLSRGGFREGTKLVIPPLEVVENTPVEVYANTTAGRERVYIVRPGDTLSKIAARKYGNSNKWRAIYNANKDKLSKPSALQSGMTIRLP